ncbi:MAG TPA: SulP family inorganic anion transporter [Acidimicrobiales bacterium]|nr:SulP family inorganic anion transporter [Acidimicrobiales bacterium]
MSDLRRLWPFAGYRRAWLRADLVGGLAAGCVVVPQAMAYATIAELPVQVGLYTCMVPMAVYAFLGGSRLLSVSTTSTIATLTASTLLAAGVAAGSEDALGDLSTLVLLVGLVLLAFRLLRLGSLVDNISDAIVTGLKIGVGLTVAAGQLPKLLGIPPDPDADTFVTDVAVMFRHLDDVQGATLALSVATVAALLVLARVAPRVPAPLLVVATGIALVAVFGLEDHGIALIAEVPSGLPAPRLPSFDAVDRLLPGAFAIALMAYLETISVARAVRRPSDPPVENDRELVANGAAAVAGSFFGSLPPAGGFSQTAVNESSGAQTQVSELVTVSLAVLAALFLGPVLDDLPEAILASLVLVAVIGLIKPAEVAFLARFDRIELLVAVATAVVGLTAGLLLAVAVGVVLNLLLLLRELNHPDVDELRPLTGAPGSLVPASDDDAGPPVPGLLVLRVGAPLYTANARTVQRLIVDRVAAAGRPVRVVVLDATVVGRLTVTVLGVGRELEQQLAEQGVEIWIASLPPRALAQAHEAPGWAAMAAAGQLYPTAAEAVAAFRREPGSRADPTQREPPDRSVSRGDGPSRDEGVAPEPS